MTPMKHDTPLTDAKAFDINNAGFAEYYSTGPYVSADFARELEQDRRRLLNLIRCHRKQTESDDEIVELAKVADGYYGEE